MFNLSLRQVMWAGLAIVVMAVSGAAYADEIADSIKEGLDYYKNGEYTEAVSSLNYAAQLIQQKKSETLTSFLPKPLPGWNASAASSQAMGTAMFGGGVTAEREYTKGGSRITVQLITDSPVMQSVAMMMTNPMFATSDGGKLEKIRGQKAVVKYDPQTKEGDINIIVANRFLVVIEGDQTTKKALKAYAKAIDYKKLATLP